MAVIWRKIEGPITHYVAGADGIHIRWSEDASEAQLFADATAANTFASGKNMLGAAQMTVGGSRNKGKKTIDA